MSPNNNMLEINGKVYKCNFAELNKSLVKTNFANTDYQCREVKQVQVIENIKADFRGYLIFDNCSVNGLPVVDKDFNVIIGNHRAEALKTMTRKQYKKVQEQYKDYFGKKIGYGYMPVRILAEDVSFAELYEVSKASNIDRESTFGEKAINNEAKYNEAIRQLPTFITAETIDDMESIVANRIDSTGNGLNVYDCNLALLTYMLGDDKEVLDCFNGIRSKGLTQANKMRDMLVSNAGAIWNLINDKRLSHIDLREMFVGAIRSLSFTHTQRLVSDNALLSDLNDYLSLTNEAKELLLEVKPNYIKEFMYACIGNSISKFLEQENPKGAFFGFISTLADRIVEDNSASLLQPTSSVKDVTMYEILPYFINNGRITYIQNDLAFAFARLKDSNQNPSVAENAIVEIKEQKMEQEKEIEIVAEQKVESDKEVEFYRKAFGLFPLKKTLHFYADPAHGWLKVPLRDLDKLGIKDKISECSYYRGEFAYLEEDCDMSMYLYAMRALGYKVNIVYHSSNRSSVVRNFETFPRIENFMDMYYNAKDDLLAIAKNKVQKAISAGIFEVDSNGDIKYAESKTEKDFAKVA